MSGFWICDSFSAGRVVAYCQVLRLIIADQLAIEVQLVQVTAAVVKIIRMIDAKQLPPVLHSSVVMCSFF